MFSVVNILIKVELAKQKQVTREITLHFRSLALP